jgi:hypothetical protein
MVVGIPVIADLEKNMIKQKKLQSIFCRCYSYFTNHSKMTNIFVANMASYVICSRLILVIHDNMINGTNHIVECVFVDIYRSHGCNHNQN